METALEVTGSEKQVRWAQSIVAEWNASFARIVTEAETRVANGTMPAIWGDHVTTTVNHVKSRIAILKKASDIIDMKQRSNVPALVEKQIADTWKA
jgi:hypothetical protein